MILGVHLVVVLIGAAFAFSIGTLVYSLIPVKSDIAKRLERVEALAWDGSGSRSEIFAKIFNREQRTRLRQKLDEAGWYTVTPAKMALRQVAFGLLALTVGLFYVTAMGDGPMWYVGVLVVTVLGAYQPQSRLSGAIKKRKVAIQKALPDFLDMLASTVSAGLAFNAALAYAQEVAQGPLGEEIKASLSEVRLGRSRADSLRSMAARVRQEQLSSVVTAVVQAERLGSNMSLVLRELSEEVRNRRMMRAEELANLMPTKMVIPMALFMLPALFVMIFGGVVAEFLSKPPG
ncbi:MAG: type II secretion system F family protein [Candidatus Eremiobacteraeota bacterium]|nr:type II secretion system F family protein [Candidatus Eremiobacteraeota bacterium]